MIDFFSLGFFKKIRWFSKIYYPFYRLYSAITLSTLSRSIYYYLISKFSKKRIRLLYLISVSLLSILILFDFDQHQYYPEVENTYLLSNNFYDNKRPKDDYINYVSIESDYIDRPHFQLFLRYNPSDNSLISSNCKDYTPLRSEGLNWAFTMKSGGGNLQFGDVEYSDEDFKSLLDCQSSIYQVAVNDSVYHNLKYYFYKHPSKSQKGLLTNVPTDNFIIGENTLLINKVSLDSLNNVSASDYIEIPFWYNPL